MESSDLEFSPANVASKFRAEFSQDPLLTEMKRCIKHSTYWEINDIRRVLTHRGMPPRKFYAGGERNGMATIPTNLPLKRLGQVSQELLDHCLTCPLIAVVSFLQVFRLHLSYILHGQSSHRVLSIKGLSLSELNISSSSLILSCIILTCSASFSLVRCQYKEFPLNELVEDADPFERV